MNFLAADEITQLAFSISENKGVYAILIGSGLSRAAQIPTGWEITLDLIRRTAAAKGITDQPDWAQWHLETTGSAPDYSKALEAIATTPAERRSVLHSYIEPSAEDLERGLKVPTKAHAAIAEMVASGHIKVIVTTNFDRLMESALRAKGIEPTVVASVDALVGAEPLSHSGCYILKLHGDYKDARLLNTEDELGKYPPDFDRLLDRILDEYGLIISGWSGQWDEALRSALMRAPNRRYSTYWTTRSELKPEAQDLAIHRAARIVTTTDADTFFTQLLEKVRTLEQARQINPRSVDLTLASVKRFLSKPEFRIELDDLVTSEAEKLLAEISGLNFTSNPTPETFKDAVSRYEAASETMAKVAGILGRFGDGSELPIVYDVLKAIYSSASKIASGFTVWIELRAYPAVLIFTAYALGLVRSQRWRDLHKLLRLELAREHREPQTVIDTLFAGAWEGGSNDWWRWLPDLERRHTALNDHLLEIFQEWGKRFIGLSADFPLVFDRFEILAALAGFEGNTLATLKQTKADRAGQQFAYLPRGRFGWNRANRSAIMQEMQNPEVQRNLLQAGFANGSNEMLGLFFETVGHVAGRHPW